MMINNGRLATRECYEVLVKWDDEDNKYVFWSTYDLCEKEEALKSKARALKHGAIHSKLIKITTEEVE